MQMSEGRGWAQMLMLAVPPSPKWEQFPLSWERFGVFLTKVLLALNIWRFGWGAVVGRVTEIQFVHEKPPLMSEIILSAAFQLCCPKITPGVEEKLLQHISVSPEHTQGVLPVKCDHALSSGLTDHFYFTPIRAVCDPVPIAMYPSGQQCSHVVSTMLHIWSKRESGKADKLIGSKFSQLGWKAARSPCSSSWIHSQPRKIIPGIKVLIQKLRCKSMSTVPWTNGSTKSLRTV